MGIVKEHKTVVVPGEVLANGMDYLPGEGTYRQGEDVIAQQTGLLEVKGRLLKILPLAGKYLPQKGDTIIGKIIDITMSGWRVEINSAYSAMLPLKDATSAFIPRGGDLSKYFDFEEHIVCRISNVTGQMLVDLSMRGPGLRKLEEGRIIQVGCTKVPRVIGKQGSMVSMIKQATGCKIIIGQNGLCWISGEPKDEILAVQTIRMIEDNAHMSGLTDKIREHLEEKTGKTISSSNDDKRDQDDVQ
ncbi:MAG: exosome complex RNA-binding protein Rrp4 [Candidatus Woesearchaeota archaeon]